MTSPYPLIATRNPITKTVPLNQLPVGTGGLALYDQATVDREGILLSASAASQDIVEQYIGSIDNAPRGSRHDIYCRGGVQPERLTITSRTDVFLDYVMPTQPVMGGLLGIDGDGWVPALASDSMCDAQGLT